MNWSPESTKKNIHFWCGKPSESAGKPLPGGIQLPKASSTCMPSWPPLCQGLSLCRPRARDQQTNGHGHGVTESGWDMYISMFTYICIYIMNSVYEKNARSSSNPSIWWVFQCGELSLPLRPLVQHQKIQPRQCRQIIRNEEYHDNNIEHKTLKNNPTQKG